MDKPINLEVVRGERQEKEVCLYCGSPPHATALACPRIESITVIDGEIREVHFWFDDDNPVAPDAA